MVKTAIIDKIVKTRKKEKRGGGGKIPIQKYI